MAWINSLRLFRTRVLVQLDRTIRIDQDQCQFNASESFLQPSITEVEDGTSKPTRLYFCGATLPDDGQLTSQRSSHRFFTPEHPYRHYSSDRCARCEP